MAALAHGSPGPRQPLPEDESLETPGAPLLPAPAASVASVARGRSPRPPPASMGLRASGTGQLPVAAVVHGAGPGPLGPPRPLPGSGSGTGTAPPPAAHLRAEHLPRLRPVVPTWLVRAPVLPAHDAPVLLCARLAHDRLERVEPGEPGPLQAERTREQRGPWGHGAPAAHGLRAPPQPFPGFSARPKRARFPGNAQATTALPGRDPLGEAAVGEGRPASVRAHS